MFYPDSRMNEPDENGYLIVCSHSNYLCIYRVSDLTLVAKLNVNDPLPVHWGLVVD
jgi:hypothetical protein